MADFLNTLTGTTQLEEDEKYVNQFFSDTHPGNFAVLKLAVNVDDNQLIELYKTHISNHNNALLNSAFPNSGFDVFVPIDTVFDSDFVAKFVDLKIKSEMIYCDKNMKVTVETEDGDVELNGASYSSSYCMYPRSSISKTPLMMANHVGIIDSGYRGNLIAAVRKFPQKNAESVYTVEKHTRLFQICHPTLCPVFVVLVEEYELNSSKRGEGGFGSTGAKGLAIL